LFEFFGEIARRIITKISNYCIKFMPPASAKFNKIKFYQRHKIFKSLAVILQKEA